MAICAISTSVSAQYQNYPQAKPIKPLPTQQLPNPYLAPQKSFASAPGDISSYLPLIQKYVPGASLTLPSTAATPPAAAPAVPSYAALTQQQLPKLQAPAAFYNPQPSTVLTPPQQYSVPNSNFYDVPVPSQELQVPSQMQWNPDNDPRFYYNPSPAPVKEELPTNLHPKKFDKQIHATAKPYVKAKDSGSYQNANQYDSYKQKKIEKTKQNLAKHENQKRVKAEKANKVQKAKVKNEQVHPAPKNEPNTAETGYLSGYDSNGHDHHSSGFTEGLNSELKAALHDGGHHSPKERLEFQMHGHDGPDSYKWGFDHGEG